MPEREEFLTKEDERFCGVDFSANDLNFYNNHPIGDGDGIPNDDDFQIKSKRTRKELPGQISFYGFEKEPYFLKTSGLPLYLLTIQIKRFNETNLIDSKDKNLKNKRDLNLNSFVDIDLKSVNQKYIAYINSESLDIVNNIFGGKVDSRELIKKLIKKLTVFDRGSKIFFDKNYTARLGGTAIIAARTKTLDYSDCPFGSESYIYLSNLTRNPKILKDGHTHIIEDSHPTTFSRGSLFFARPVDSIELKISNPSVNKNGISEKKQKRFKPSFV